jgi:hypothetical protein
MLKKTIIISKEVYKQIGIAAAEREISRLELIRQILENWLKDNGKA